MNMIARRRMLESLSSFASEPLYIYRGGEVIENCTHRSETFEGLIPGTIYDACDLYFGDDLIGDYFYLNASNHQNAFNKTVYYFYLDVTRYKKIILRCKESVKQDGTQRGAIRVGVFDRDGLLLSDFTEENSKEVPEVLLYPENIEFDVTNLKGKKVLAFGLEEIAGRPFVYELRME